MSSRFTALPLTSGESFVLETDHEGERKVILVDGGQSTRIGLKKNPLYKALRKCCPDIKDTIDIAICTHRDHDHAGGFPAFIETWLAEGNYIGELWLPGGWSGVVHDAVTNPDRLLSKLHVGAMEAALRVNTFNRRHETENQSISAAAITTERPSFESIEQQLRASYLRDTNHEREIQQPRQEYSEQNIRYVANSWGFDEEDWESIQSSLESGSLFEEPLIQRAKRYRHGFREFVFMDESSIKAFDTYEEFENFRFITEFGETAQLGRSFFNSTVETAEAIRKISQAAILSNVPVRWFDFELFEQGQTPTGGYQEFLIPLNTVEIPPPTRAYDSIMMFMKLRLTEQNVSSLVFQRVETNSEPSVIFLGDSRLAFGIDKPTSDFKSHMKKVTRPIIYTAAHHGSRINDRAYDVLAKWLPSELFDKSIAIRNGGMHRQTLGKYLQIKYRRCAQCYQCHGGDWEQLVQVVTNNKMDWSWPPNTGMGKTCGTPKKKKP